MSSTEAMGLSQGSQIAVAWSGDLDVMESETIPSWATVIHHAKDEGGLEASFCLGLDRFLYQLLPTIEFSPALIHPNFDQRPESITKESYESGLFRGCVSVRTQEG